MNNKQAYWFGVCLIATGLGQAFTPTARASDLQTTLTLTSNYFWRGYSKSDEHGSAQLNIDYSHFAGDSGYFAGAWLSSVDFGDQAQAHDTDSELILYGGWTKTLNDAFSFDLQISHYLYDDEVFGERADYTELYLFLHYRDLVTGEVAFAPDAYRSGESTLNSQLTFRYPLSTLLDFSAGVGYFAAREVFAYDYRYFNAGVSWRSRRFSLDLRYFGARETNVKLSAPGYGPYDPYRPYGPYPTYQRELPYSDSATVVTLSAGF